MPTEYYPKLPVSHNKFARLSSRPPLTSRSLCYWRVRVWDAKKQISSWSPVARFGVGILNKSQMQGEYIGASAEGGKICAPILRKKVKLTQRETSFLHVNTLGYHEIYVNGKKVGEDVLTPAVSHLSKRSLIVTYDILLIYEKLKSSLDKAP